MDRSKIIPDVGDLVMFDIGPLFQITKIHKFDEEKEAYFVHIERPEEYIEQWETTIPFESIDVFVFMFDDRYKAWHSARNFVKETWNNILVYRYIPPTEEKQSTTFRSCG